MNSTAIDTTADVGRYLATFVAQLALVGVAVLLGRQGLEPRTTMAAVLGVGALNAALVLVVMMDARRGSWMLWALVILVLVFATALLLWPAWDLLERARLS